MCLVKNIKFLNELEKDNELTPLIWENEVLLPTWTEARAQ